MRTRPGDSLTEAIELPEPPDEVLDRTERVIDRFRQEYADLLGDVEKMREAAAALPAQSGRHLHRGHDRVEHRLEQHLEALITSLPKRVSDLVAAELANPNVNTNVKAALNHLVDMKLFAVTEAIARINGDPKPELGMRRRRSRRFR